MRMAKRSEQKIRLGRPPARICRIGRRRVAVEVLENPFDDEWILDAGNDLELPATTTARLDVDRKDTLEALRPDQGSLPVASRWLAGLYRLSVATGGLATLRARCSSLSRCEAFAVMPACSEKPELSATSRRGPSGSAGSVCSVKTFCPSLGPVAIRYVIDAPSRLLVGGSSPGSNVRHAFSMSRNEPRVLERAADPFGDPLHQPLQLPGTRSWHGHEPQAAFAFPAIDPIEHEQVKVDIEIERAAESLDQRHGAGQAACARETRLANQLARDRPIDDAEYLRHDLGLGRKQIAQRKLQ